MKNPVSTKIAIGFACCGVLWALAASRIDADLFGVSGYPVSVQWVSLLVLIGIAAFAEEDQARALAHDQADVMVMPFAELLAMNITVPTDLHEAGHGHNNG